MITLYARVFKGFLAVSLVSILSACQENQLVEIGSKAPQIGVLNLAGETVDLKMEQGKITVLNFWQGGCLPCLDEMPHLQAVQDHFTKDSVRIISVNRGGSPKIIEDVIAQTGVTYDFAIDQLDVAATRYQIHFYPTTFIVDGEGVIREKVMGEVTEANLTNTINHLQLAQK